MDCRQHFQKQNSTTNAITLLFQVNFTFISSNIQASPTYGVYISQFIRYFRDCVQYSNFLGGAHLLTQKLLKQGYVARRLQSSLQKSQGCHHNLINRSELSTSQMTMNILPFEQIYVFFPRSLPILLPDLPVYTSNTWGVL